MINTMMRVFNQNWLYKETMPMNFLVEDAGDSFRVIIKNTCSWYRHSGGCTMCNYSDRSGICATTIIENNREMIIEQLIGLDKKYSKLKFYINGSFFNEEELDFDVSIDFINQVKKQLGIKEICVESRPEFVTIDKVNRYILKTNMKYEICFGIESTNDEIRNSCLNKGVDLNRFYVLAKQLGMLCNVKVYLLVKPPFLTEKQAIEDIVNSVNELVERGIYNISYTPIAVQNNTVLEFLLQEKLYRPVWIWSLIEINTQLRIIREKHPNIHLSGLDYFPKPILSAFNCNKCSQKLLDLLRKNRNLVWEDVENFKNCECYSKWKNEINDNTIPLSIKSQIQMAVNLLNKNIDRTEQIENRTNAPKRAAFLTDVAKTVPNYNIALDYVGIENLRIPIRISGYADSVAKCSYSIELDEFHRGIHMSRLVEQLNAFANIFHEDLLKDVDCLLKSNADVNSEIKIECELLKKVNTLLTNKENFIRLTLNLSAVSDKRDFHKNVEISVPFINACPCTLVTANELFDESFTHTQKGIIQVVFCDVMVPFGEMLLFVEEYISIYDMLKREDEIYVVKTAFNNAAFCEDICREISHRLFNSFCGKGRKIKLKVITDESIHPHRAFAKKEILL